MALPPYHWRDIGAVDTLRLIARVILLFCGLLGGLFAIEMLEPLLEAVILSFTGLLAALSIAIVLPFDDAVIAWERTL